MALSYEFSIGSVFSKARTSLYVISKTRATVKAILLMR